MSSEILIVDDEIDITDTLKNYLTLEGFDVITANGGTQALEIIKKQNIRIVISDISMPDMSGLDLLKEIKIYDGLIQVIMITGYVTLFNILNAFRLGANNCFFKPLESLDVLKEEINLAINKLKRIQAVLQERSQLKI